MYLWKMWLDIYSQIWCSIKKKEKIHNSLFIEWKLLWKSTLNSHKSDYTHASAMVVFNSHTIVKKVQENENSFCTNLNRHADHWKQRVSFSFNTCSIELYLFNLFGQSISLTPNIHLPIKAESIELFIAHSFVPWCHYINRNTLCPNNRKQIALPLFCM